MFSCDHASHRVPRCLGDLGLAKEDLQDHIGWDPGAAELTETLARRFDAPAALSNYSRLVIDCNRAPGRPDSIPEVSDGVYVPGNFNLPADEALERKLTFFWPYHETIATLMDDVRARGDEPCFVAIHTFTPKLRSGFARAWHYGVLWDRDERIGPRLIAALRRHPGLVVGDNEPYSARDNFDFSQGHHATSKGLASALIEVRADLVREPEGLRRHARILGDALEQVFDLVNIRHGGQ